MSGDGLASKKIQKRTGLVSTPLGTGTSAARPDLISAATKMPSFDFGRPGEDAPSPGNDANVTPLHAAGERGIVRIPVSLLVDSPYQPRFGYDDGKIAELAESLANRQIDPLVVRRLPDNRFEIISGHRRKRAAPLAKLDSLECRVIDVSDSEARVLVLAANEPREDFTDYERAVAYQAIIEDGKVGGEVRSQRQLAQKVGVDVALVNRRLSMLELPQVVQEVLKEHPGAFSCKWVKKLLELTKGEFDAEKLRAALLRVAAGELQMSAVFSVMATSATTPAQNAPQRGLLLHRGNRLFAQVTPNKEKRHVVVKLPSDDCDIQEVADLILAAINQRFTGKS